MGTAIYLAARYSRNPEMRAYRDLLEAIGYSVTSRWIDLHPDVVGDFSTSFETEILNAHPEKCAPLAEHDKADIRAADLVISFTGGGGKGGRHWEMGYADALDKDLMIVGEREHVFHTPAKIIVFSSWTACYAHLWNDGELVVPRG